MFLLRLLTPLLVGLALVTAAAVYARADDTQKLVIKIPVQDSDPVFFGPDADHIFMFPSQDDCTKAIHSEGFMSSYVRALASGQKLGMPVCVPETETDDPA